jgi:hypothetical protein
MSDKQTAPAAASTATGANHRAAEAARTANPIMAFGVADHKGIPHGLPQLPDGHVQAVWPDPPGPPAFPLPYLS